jgi:hypothetical protein
LYFTQSIRFVLYLPVYIAEKSYRLKTDLLSVEALLASLPAITDFSTIFHRVQNTNLIIVFHTSTFPLVNMFTLKAWKPNTT